MKYICLLACLLTGMSAAAQFNPVDPPEPSVLYRLTLSAQPTAGGSVSGAGNYQGGSTVTVNASPSSGYSFVRWVDRSGTEVSTSRSYKFAMPASDHSLKAIFQYTPNNPDDPAQPKEYVTVSAKAVPSVAGYVSGTGRYEAGAVITLTANTYADYSFSHWTKGGETIGKSYRLSYTVEETDNVLVANYVYTPGSPGDPSSVDTTPKFPLFLKSYPAGTASFNVSSSGKYAAGQTVSLTAYPITDYVFDKWLDAEGKVVSTSRSIDFTMPEGQATLTAACHYSPSNPGDPSYPTPRRNVIYGTREAAVPGHATIFSILLENVDQMTGMNVDIKTPDGYGFRMEDAALSSRTDGHTLTVTDLGGGSYRLQIQGTAPFTGGNGPMVRIPAYVADDAEIGMTVTVPLSKGVAYFADGRQEPIDAIDGYIRIVDSPESAVISPDLVVSTISVEKGSYLPGDMLEVNWMVENKGNADALGGWTETLFMVDADGRRASLGNLQYDTQLLEAGGKVSRSGVFKIAELPGVSGPLNAGVSVAPYAMTGEVEELQENNTTIGQGSPIDLGKVLVVDLPETVSEGIDTTIRGRLARSGSWADSETFTIKAVKEDSRFSFPSEVTLTRNQSSAYFQMSLADNDVPDPVKSIVLEISGADYAPVTREIHVTDNDFPEILLDTSVDDVTEGETFELIIELPEASEEDLNVTLKTDHPDRLTLPQSVTVAAGEIKAIITITATDNSKIDGDDIVSIFASAPRYMDGETFLNVLDDDIPTLELEIIPSEVAESAGPQAARGIIRRVDKLDTKVTIRLQDDSGNTLLYPSKEVVLEKGVESAEFTIGVTDNGLKDGDREYTLTASVYISSCSCSPAGERGGSVSASLKVIDDDGAALTLRSSSTSLLEGSESGVTLTVTRNTDTTQPLTVTLSSDADDALVYDHTATIFAGERSATVKVTAPANDREDDGRTVVFTAEAQDFSKGTCWVMLTDRTMADGVISQFNVSETDAPVNGTVEANAVILNQGAVDLPEGYSVSFYLNSEVVGKGYLQQPLAPGEKTTLNKTIQLPSKTGTAYIKATANPDKSIAELSYTNNSSAVVNVNVTAPYTAVLKSSKDLYSPGEEIAFSGTLTGNDTAETDVEVYVINSGARQVLEAKTDEGGKFSVTFKPYSSQSGLFTAGACYPGEGLKEGMTSFEIMGLKFDSQKPVTCESTVGTISTIAVGVKNQSSAAVSGLKCKVVDVPDNFEVKAECPSSVAGNGSADITLRLTSDQPSESAEWQKIRLELTADGGITLPLTVYAYSRNPRGILKTGESHIKTNLTWGSVLEYPVVITNTGEGETGSITLSLPEWMSTSTPTVLPSLKADESLTAILSLTTNDKMSLNCTMEGQIGVNCTNGMSAVITYEITPVSEEKGTLHISACDEYTYYTAEAPKVAGASVKVMSPSTGETLTESVTSSDGECEIELNAGYYRIEVSAEKHKSYADYVFISPGATTDLTADISYNPITISWNVVETEVEDEYSIETVVKYETDVPMPVVKMDMPKSIDGDNMAVGDATIIDVTLTNIGLIKASEVTLLLPKDLTEWEFEALDHAEPFDLAAHASVTIPVRITRIADVMAENPAVRKSIGKDMINTFGDCMTHVAETYKIMCGELLSTNVSAENLALKMCATSATMAAIINSLNEVLSKAGIYGPSIGTGGGMTAGGGGYGGYGVGSPESKFTICDPCDAQKAEKLINKMMEYGSLSDLNKKMDELIKYYRKYGSNIEISSIIVDKLTDELEDRFPTNPSNIVDKLAKKYIPGYKIYKYIIEIKELVTPCDKNENIENPDSQKASKRSGKRDWMEIFDNDAKYALAQLTTMDDIYTRILGDSIWLTDITRDKLDFMTYASSLDETAVPTDAELMVKKPESVTLQQARAFVDNCRKANFDTLHKDAIFSKLEEYEQGEKLAVERGFTNSTELFDQSFKEYKNKFEEMKNSSVCASVSLKISQTMTMTRQAFRGSLVVFNGHDSKPMQDVRLNLVVRDEEGNVATSREFQIVNESLSGFAGQLGLPGEWALDAEQTGEAQILFIPTKNAAPEKDMMYSFGGTLSYLDPYTDLVVTRTLYPVELTVRPCPELDMIYFMQRDVYGDDPHTELTVEPSYPAEFALVITNHGNGEASNVRMKTALPEIVENEKGLLIDFSIESSQLNGEEKTLSLGRSIATDFGSIAPNSSIYAQWWLKSSLLGHFTDYDISATHVTSYGNPDLSLLDKIEIHELIHGFSSLDHNSSEVRAFLVNDIQDADDLPDFVYFSDGSEPSPVTAASACSMSKIDNLNYSVKVTPGDSRWTYGHVNDLTRGSQKLISVRRTSDNALLPVDNFWQTGITMRDGMLPLHEALLHFAVQSDTSEEYLLTFAERPEKTLEVKAFSGIPEELTVFDAPVRNVTVIFNKEIDPYTFDTDDVTLSCQGENVDLSGISINRLSDSEFNLDISNATSAPGYYVLTVNTVDIIDCDGFYGENGKSASWVQKTGSGVEVIGDEGRFEAYPLPMGTVVNLNGDYKVARNVTLYCMDGTIAGSWHDLPPQSAVEVGYLTKGFYILEVVTDKCKHVLKVFKE